MKKDFDLITWKLPRELEYIHLYPMGDPHVGSQEFSEELWDKWIKKVLADPVGYVVIIGDMFDNALKGSKTDCFDARMRPRDQKKWLTTELSTISGKILGVTPGNHEYRSVYATDDCPLYDVMCKLDLEDIYRENMAFIKVSLGEKNSERQFSYNIVLAHGGSKTKANNFGYSIDGMDVFVTGHNHQAGDNFPAKIVIDSRNEKVGLSGYIHVTVPSFQIFGGYVMKGLYMPQDSTKIPIIALYGTEKGTDLHWV